MDSTIPPPNQSPNPTPPPEVTGVPPPPKPTQNDQNVPSGTTLPPQAPPVPPPPPPPTSTPKVVDLSGHRWPKGGGFGSRKAFILGVVFVAVLAILAIIIGSFYIRQRITVPPKAAVSLDDSNWTKTNARGPSAQATLVLKNNSSSPVTVRFKRETYWCDNVKIEGPDNGPNPVLHCFKNGKADWEKSAVTIPAGGSSPAFTVSQPVGGNGQCGSAQVDIWWHVEGTTDNKGPYWGVAYLDACKPPPPPPPPSPSLSCTSVTLGGGGNTIKNPSETRTLTGNATGGQGTITFSWAVTSDGLDKGTLSAASGNPVTWTAPASLPASQTWAITATATDSKGQSNSSGCTQTLSFAAAQTFKHNICDSNNACVSVDCSPKTTDCSKSTDCKTSADCKPATHKECRNNACVDVSGAGQDNCPNNCQTQQTFQHKVCLSNNSCSSVDCSPNTSPCADSCSVSSDCGAAPPPSSPPPTTTTPTHKECQNNTCISVSGAGADKCTSDVSCQPVAKAPPIPKSGSPELTIGGLLLGAGALVLGIILAL